MRARLCCVAAARSGMGSGERCSDKACSSGAECWVRVCECGQRCKFQLTPAALSHLQQVEDLRLGGFPAHEPPVANLPADKLITGLHAVSHGKQLQPAVVTCQLHCPPRTARQPQAAGSGAGQGADVPGVCAPQYMLPDIIGQQEQRRRWCLLLQGWLLLLWMLRHPLVFQ